MNPTLDERGQGRRNFQFRECLGRGGFGEVYRALMISPGGVQSEVAVKVLHAEVDPASQAVERLRDEGRLLGALNHPSVLKVHDLVVLQDRVALVTEYVEGQDLTRCMTGEGALSSRALVEVIGRVAGALDGAWKAPSPTTDAPMHLVHRDIKPANIRLGRHGDVKLLDFGIARAANVERESQTQEHSIVGSYQYMSPERFLEEDLGPASDIYALGCVLYEALAGEKLFAGKSLRELYGLVHKEELAAFLADKLQANIFVHLPAAEPSSVELPPAVAVAHLLRRMLAVEPSHRPTAAEVMSICDEMADSLPGPNLGRWARGRTWPTPKRVVGPLEGATLTETEFVKKVRRQALSTMPPSSEASGTMDLRMSVPPVAVEKPKSGGGAMRVAGAVAALGALGVAVVGALGIGALLAWGSGTQWGAASEAPAPAPAPVAAVAPPPPAPAPPPVVAAPVPVAAPAPVAAPVARPVAVAPAPPPAPAPEPVTVIRVEAPPPPPPVAIVRIETPPPPSPTGNLVITGGGVFVQVKGAAGVVRPGPVPEGTYEIFADFGDGVAPAGRFLLPAGATVEVACSKIRRTCNAR